MSLKVSSGLRDGMLSTNSLKALLAGGLLKIYAGTPPASADDALGSAVLLSTISVDGSGDGINLDTASGGTISKDPSETWEGTNVASGLATFYRLVAAGDTGVLSASEMRIQGTVGSGAADLNMTNPNLTSGAVQSVDYFTLSIPPL